MIKHLLSILRSLTVSASLAATLMQPASAEILPALDAQQAQDWAAVGVVNIDGPNGMALCSGTLIAPDLVLTAIHCAPNKAGKRVFVVGGIGDLARVSIPSTKIQHHPAYATTTGTTQFRVDLALIALARPVAAEIAMPLPLAVGQAQADRMGIVAFHRMRPGALNGRFDCAVQPAADFIIGCQVIAGNSGSPALIQTPDGWQIAGVVVARLDSGTAKNALIAPIDTWVRAKLRQHLKTTP